MIRQDIIKKINQEHRKLSEKINGHENSDLLLFLNDFITECDITNIANIDIVNLAIAHLLTKTDLSFEDIKKVITENKFFFCKVHSISFNQNIKSINRIIKERKNEKKPQENWETKTENFSLKILNKTSNICLIIDLFEKEQETMLSCCNLIGYLRKVKSMKQKADKKNQEFDLESVKYKKHNGEVYTKELAFNILSIIKGHCEYMIDSIKKEGRGDIRELRRYLFVKDWLLENQDTKEITNLPQELLKINNQKLKIEILKEIYNHNYKYYQKIETEQESPNQKKKSIDSYQILFKKYNLDISQIEPYLDIDFSSLEKMLNSLENLAIPKEQILSIISNSNLKAITEITTLVSKGFISKKFVFENLEIFTSGYDNLIKNITLLQEKGLSISTILKMEESLIENNQKLEERIQILDSYDLLLSFKNSTSLDFIKSERFENLIDQIIELGFEQFLEDDLDLLNIDPTLLKRVVILKRLNIPIEKKEELLNILSTSKFSISDDNLDSYIFDITPYIEDDLSDIEISKEAVKEQLENYQKTKYAYDFNGEIISINKVNRNLDSIEKDSLNGNELLNCIISNKVLDQDGYQKIKNFITNQKYVLKKQ